jgi:hypothetical protein
MIKYQPANEEIQESPRNFAKLMAFHRLNFAEQ